MSGLERTTAPPEPSQGSQAAGTAVGWVGGEPERALRIGRFRPYPLRLGRADFVEKRANCGRMPRRSMHVPCAMLWCGGTVRKLMPFESPADFTARGWRRATGEDGPSLAAFVKGLIAAWLLLQLFDFAFDIAMPDHSPSRAMFALPAQLLHQLLWTLAVVWLAIRYRSVMVASLRVASWRVIAAAFLGGIVLMSGEILVYALLDHYRLADFHKMFDFPEKGIAPASFLIGGALLATCVPVAEEIIFRGAILTWLARKMPATAAIATSSLLFALVHLRMVWVPGSGGWLITAGIFVIGTANAVLALKTRSLWPGIFLHSAANATASTAQIFLPMF